MDITALMLAERARLEAKLAKEVYEFEKARYPEGRLKIKKAGKYLQYYHVKPIDKGKTHRFYISKENLKLVKALAIKSYKERLIYSLKRELQAIDAYLKLYPKDNGDALFRISPEFKALLAPVIVPQIDVGEWASEEYEQSNEYPEFLKHITMKGHLVRSKSEVMIADELYRRGIPYRYECALKFDGETFHPDFTILDPATRKIYIWEHFGLMDSPKYIAKFQYKMGVYVKNRYLPKVNMICTFENEAFPLTSVEVNEVIDHYFKGSGVN